MPSDKLCTIVALMLSEQMLYLYTESGDKQSANSFNKKIISSEIENPTPYNFLAACNIGGGVRVNKLDKLNIHFSNENVENPYVHLIDYLNRLNMKIEGAEGSMTDEMTFHYLEKNYGKNSLKRKLMTNTGIEI